MLFLAMVTMRMWSPWCRHQTKKKSALLAICAGNSPVTSEFLAQRPVTRSFGVFFGLRLNKPSSKQWWGWWFETLSRPLWRHCNATWTWKFHIKRIPCLLVAGESIRKFSACSKLSTGIRRKISLVVEGLIPNIQRISRSPMVSAYL